MEGGHGRVIGDENKGIAGKGRWKDVAGGKKDSAGGMMWCR